MKLFSEVVRALQMPQAYPHPVGDLKTITTAVSVVFLTGSYAYKINKPMNLGFLDFSTLEKRKNQCEKEVRYNSLASPELYLGTIAITQEQDESIIINGKGKVIEYGIKMKQVDPNATMNQLLQQNKVTDQHIKKLAQKIIQFHQKAPSDAEISSYGNVETVQFNWNENFSQTEKYIPTMVKKDEFIFMQDNVNRFIHKNQHLFTQRVLKGSVKHCHGDFHSSNVFILPENVYIFDGIVFNMRFPCSDVIAEIAFMAMDLEFHQQDDLAREFIAEYQRLSGDNDIPLLLDFYKCYRAYIRAKINCFTSEDKNISAEERQNAIEKAQAYFALAKRYAERL